MKIRVKVTPKAKRSEITGWGEDGEGMFLRVKLAAPPVDGKANAALIRFLAMNLGLGKGQVRILQGEKSRMKVVEVEAEEGIVRELGGE